MREPKNQMLGTMVTPLMQLSVKVLNWQCIVQLHVLELKELFYVVRSQIHSELWSDIAVLFLFCFVLFF